MRKRQNRGSQPARAREHGSFARAELNQRFAQFKWKELFVLTREFPGERNLAEKIDVERVAHVDRVVQKIRVEFARVTRGEDLINESAEKKQRDAKESHRKRNELAANTSAAKDSFRDN